MKVRAGLGLFDIQLPIDEGKVTMITCFIRYEIAPDKVPEFERYGRVWMRLIEKYGGTHLGYFLPDESPPAASFSFSDIGEQGPANIAIALFSFPTLEAYEKYRVEAASDPECLAETRHFNQTRCFTKYERTFMQPLARD